MTDRRSDGPETDAPDERTATLPGDERATDASVEGSDGRDDPVNAPADAAPELVEDADAGDERRLVPDGGRPVDRDDGDRGAEDGHGCDDDRDANEANAPDGRDCEAGNDRMPGVPDTDGGGESVPPTGGRAKSGADDPGTDDACCVDGQCACGGGEATGAGDATGAPSGGDAGLVADGGAAAGPGEAANVAADGSLGDVEFTEPASGKSQDVYDGDATARPGVPDGVDLETPDYSIRSEMNDIDTPDDKTWFMELDEAVIRDDRCIQCGTCVAACPSDSISIGDDGLPELTKMCTGCSLCWDVCPRGGLRYERQWKITGGEDNVSGAGDPITEFSARVADGWRAGESGPDGDEARDEAQDGGVVTATLVALLEAGEIDGALIATESDEDPWKAESFLATTPEECVENAGSFYNQTMALGNLDLAQWEHKLPDEPPEELSLALVGTPCEIEGIRALQDFEWDYQSHETGVRAIDYTIALMCTKNFNYERLIGDKLRAERGIDIEEVGKMDVLDGKLMVDDRDGNRLLEEDVEHFHDAALKGCDECADFTGYCADLTVGSVGSSDEYSSVIVRTEEGLDAWETVEPALEHHDLEDRSAIGKLQSWDKKKAFESLERPFDPDAPRFIDYTDHAEQYGTEPNPHEAEH